MRHACQLLALTILVTVAGRVSALAQASGSTAELRGQVTDRADAVIPNATVTLTDAAKGTSRTATTDGEGNYIFLGLLPSGYELKVEASGFAPSSTRLELTVGQQANIPIKLGAGTLEVRVDVVAGSEVVETSRTQQSSVIDDRQITNLPINRRTYLDYALLTPGVNDSDNIADASDFRVAQTPQSGLSFGGNNGRGNMVSLDGSETLNSSGGVTATVSQEAVQEFQVLRNSYSAEFGGASGGIVNIVSKSGSNSFHGSAFGLFRDDALDARNAFDFNPSGQSPYNRQQYGGSVGGPLRRDRVFFFTAFERFDEEQTTFVNLLTDPNIFQPTASQTTLFNYLGGTPFAPVAAGLRQALTTTNYPRTVQLFNDSSGQFPFNSNQTNFMARVDYAPSDKSNMYWRVNLTDGKFENQAAGALTAVSRGRTNDVYVGGGIFSHNYQLSPTLLNEVKAQFTYVKGNFIPNDGIGPEINIQGFGLFGRDIFLPSKTIERHYDLYDNVSKTWGDHTFKFGGSMLFLDVASNSETFFGGRFDFGSAIPLSNIIALNPQLGPAVLQQLTQFLQANNPSLLPALAAPINALQSYNLNLPIVYQEGFGNSYARSWTDRYALYAQDTWRVRPSLTLNYGLRYSINNEPFYIPTRYKDFQPRAGFAWDPFGDGKTVIRGGAGIFVGFVNNAVANVTTELAGFGDPTEINIVLATATSNALGLPTSFTVYQTLLQRGILGTRTITAADIAAPPIGITPRPGAPLEVRFRVGPNYQNPVTYQASLGVQRDLGGGFSLETSYLFNRGLHLTRNRDVNQFKRTGPASQQNPFGGPTFIRFPSAAQVAAGLTTDFRNPFIFQDNVYEATANSFYHALTAAVTRRFANNMSLNAHYTFAKTIDEVTDFNSDFSAQNPLDLRLDRALSAFDQRHRAVISGVFQSPLAGDSWADKVFGGWLLSPIFIAGSGRPFNLLLGFDANADGRSQSDRPGQAGRNTGKGEPFYSVDMRLARRFFARESRFLEFTFEAFNLFNRTNLLGINNIVGTTFINAADFNVSGDRSRKTTDPLGFISAANARQLQLGVRFNF